ncbi:hypothetical protein MATR_37170 [Marivirga tractuosa]|uniref:Uncharacterized protein n=1 Tax=Marivirga tractuosa (strain ATCC 23168 / DSM 4126 / NBRC 15989 / NCIMB 1408 / VKM B-1430 / H-43) TaxID=643867 RepID=E4TN23_MARTH|nr:DUF6090 family protein [Marivirga tractuosa]ADR22437.1 hypothetical protein Ftrac_2459 [Marivirga tractuosa DSM 4126]BDD16892.1 hypothetical protein MATR_37170 [Marivirga tractuosa]
MIKFFQRIRRKLLTENKFSQYLAYALGEILLVVIGILIALAINNWNNFRHDRNLEEKYLKEIASNLKQDLEDIDFNLKFNQDKYQSNQIVLEFINNNMNYNDSLNRHFGNLLGSTRSIVNRSGYETLKSKGLEIISNDSLRQMLSTHYEIKYHNIIDFEYKDDHQHQYQILWPEVINSIYIKDMWENGKPIDIAKIRDNYSLRSALAANLFLREYMISNYNRIYDNTVKVITAIEKELERE